MESKLGMGKTWLGWSLPLNSSIIFILGVCPQLLEPLISHYGWATEEEV